MALPSISTPEFQTVIPSTKETITYRPFLVKEEKILLMAMEGGDENEITNAVIKILNNCILSDTEIKSLATFDIEFLFMKLRGKSVGEVINLNVVHPDNSDCKHSTEVNINLDRVQVQGEISDGKIMLTDEVGVKMRYPTMDQVVGTKLTNSSEMFDLICGCIEFIYDQENVYQDFTQQELMDWLETLNQSQFKLISDFFEGMPKLSHKIEWTCEQCGKEDSVLVEGLQSFFT